MLKLEAMCVACLGTVPCFWLGSCEGGWVHIKPAHFQVQAPLLNSQPALEFKSTIGLLQNPGH